LVLPWVCLAVWAAVAFLGDGFALDGVADGFLVVVVEAVVATAGTVPTGLLAHGWTPGIGGALLPE
jgi:hypothetical protein